MGLSCPHLCYPPGEELARMTGLPGLPGREDTAEWSLVGGGLLPKVRVALGVVMGVAIALAAAWASVLATILLGPGTPAVMSEVFWWVVFCGVVAACVLATPVALRLWKGGVEGLRESGSDRDRALRGHAPLAAAVARPEGKHAERQLLEAIERHGEITPVRAALETTLTVAEADRMLSELAKGGYLEVRIEGGKLLYGL